MRRFIYALAVLLVISQSVLANMMRVSVTIDNQTDEAISLPLILDASYDFGFEDEDGDQVIVTDDYTLFKDELIGSGESYTEVISVMKDSKKVIKFDLKDLKQKMGDKAYQMKLTHQQVKQHAKQQDLALNDLNSEVEFKIDYLKQKVRADKLDIIIQISESN